MNDYVLSRFWVPCFFLKIKCSFNETYLNLALEKFE